MIGHTSGRFILADACLAAGCATATPGHTQGTLVSNLAQPAASDMRLYDATPFGVHSHAQRLTTGSGEGGYVLWAVTLAFGHIDDNTRPVVEVWSSADSGEPAARTAVATNRGALQEFELNTFTLPGGLTLDAHREYAVRVVNAATVRRNDTFEVLVTDSSAEDADGQADWALTDTAWEGEGSEWRRAYRDWRLPRGSRGSAARRRTTPPRRSTAG